MTDNEIKRQARKGRTTSIILAIIAGVASGGIIPAALDEPKTRFEFRFESGKFDGDTPVGFYRLDSETGAAWFAKADPKSKSVHWELIQELPTTEPADMPPAKKSVFKRMFGK